jgi:hypothetical protein
MGGRVDSAEQETGTVGNVSFSAAGAGPTSREVEDTQRGIAAAHRQGLRGFAPDMTHGTMPYGSQTLY